MAEYNPQIRKCLAYAGAALLIGASASINAAYGWQLGAEHSPWLAGVFAAGSVGGDIIKALAFVAAIEAIRRFDFGTAAAALVVGIVCLAYSSAAALGFAAASRSDLAAGRAAIAEPAALARGRLEAAQADLARILDARPAAELEALIDNALADKRLGGCLVIDGPIRREQCGQVAQWRAELARAAKRAELEAAIRGATAALSEAPAGVSEADPQAGALAAYALALGWKVDAAKVSPWLSLLAVGFFEIGSALSLVVAGAVSRGSSKPSMDGTISTPAEPVAEPAPAPIAAPVEPVALALPAPEAPVKRGRPRKPHDLGKLGTKLRANGGELRGTQAELARIVGGSKSSAHRHLHALAADGAIDIAAGRDGTVIKLRISK